MQSKLIYSPDAGIIRNKRPFKILENAFEELEDAYCSQETVRKRWGYRLLGGTIDRAQFRVVAGKTNDQGSYEGPLTTIEMSIGQRIVVGNATITILELGNPAKILNTDPTVNVTINSDAKTITISGAPANSSIGFYPGLPAMAYMTRESELTNFEDTIGMDTRFPYRRAGGYWEKFGTKTWTGSNSNFYWWINHRGPTGYERYLYVCNNNPNDPIRYLPEGADDFIDLNPKINTAGTWKLESCRFMVSFKDRIYCFDVVISQDRVKRRYRNRLIACQNGNPLQDDAWVTDRPGKGFYLDAPTTQPAILPAYLNDRLIIKFERMTFELVYTGHPNIPVKYQMIDSTLGSESTFSGITRQNVNICIGNESIDATNAVSVEHIDDNIPREVYKIHNCCEGVERVYGVQDNFSQLIYWSIPSKQHGSIFPNRILVYNYINHTWAFFNDSFTCYGKHQKREDMIWRTVKNFYPKWSVWNAPWNSGKKQSAFPEVIGGNQQGIAFIIDNQLAINSPSLVITNISGNTIKCKDHNLNIGLYIGIEGTPWDRIIVRVETMPDDDTFTIDYTFPDGYKGGGTIRRMSKFDIFTKEFDFGFSQGKAFRVPEIHMLTDTTKNGEYIIDDIQDSALSNSTWDSVERKDFFLGSNVMRTKPEELTPKRINTTTEWHVYHSHAKGQLIQWRITQSDRQMRDWLIQENPFVLHAMNFFIEPFGSIIERI